MRRADILVPITALPYSELADSDRGLVDAARAAASRAYAPYSHFHVGAAIRLDNGEIITGSNQENAAYPSGLCAERSTAFYAHSAYPDARFTAIAVAATDASGREVTAPIAPCGACRQVLLEYETLAGCDVRVILAGASEIFILPSVRSLLPVSFAEIP